MREDNYSAIENQPLLEDDDVMLSPEQFAEVESWLNPEINIGE